VPTPPRISGVVSRRKPCAGSRSGSPSPSSRSAADGRLHYVTLYDGRGGTILERVDVSHGGVFGWNRFKGSWGIPTLAAGVQTGEGLSWNGRTLVLASTAPPYSSPSKFLLVDARRLQVDRTIVLPGSFSFDALSPDASRLYLIEYTHGQTGDLSRYIVRGYDLRTNRLLAGRIADRTQRSWAMKGSPLTRTWSGGGRWVYTLYENPGGYPFIHALDTVRGVAHCIRLPWEEDRSQNGLYNLVLGVRDGGRTLAVDWKSGRP
jgi:hypothetical protein